MIPDLLVELAHEVWNRFGHVGRRAALLTGLLGRRVPRPVILAVGPTVDRVGVLVGLRVVIVYATTSLLPTRTVGYGLNRLEEADFLTASPSLQDARKQVYELKY